jgi:hypothetical protein
MILMALSIGVLCFIYRFNTLGGPLAGFDNDHFFQIVRAEAMLNGELPLRDWMDAELRSLWPPLTYATSALAMKTMGRSLRSEAILSVGMLAFGTALLYWVAASASHSTLAAALATLLAVGLSPTLYNYPKIAPYAVAVIAMLAYARRPGVWRLLALALTVVVATLYRHDHGVYLGISSFVLLLLVNGPGARKPLFAFAAFVLIGLIPGLVFAQQHGGAIDYLRACLVTSGREAGRSAAAPTPIPVPFQLDWSQPWLARMPPPPVPAPRIAVQWATPLDPEARALAERELGLTDPERRSDDRSWSYSLAEPSRSHVALIVGDPRVGDTDGIDRQTFALTSQPAAAAARGGVFGWRIAPGVLQKANAAPWLRLVGWSVIVASLVCMAWPRLRRAVEQPDVPSAFIAAVGVLGILLCIVFLRNTAAYRLPDISVPAVVLSAWLMTAIPRATRAHPRPLRAAIAAILATTMGLTIVSIGVAGTVPEQVVGTGVGDGVSGVADRWREVWKTLGDVPNSLSSVDQALGSAASYLRRCTVPSDRLLATEYVPEINYFARRGVASGQSVFFGGFYTQDEAQRQAIERWSQQSVPIVLTQPAERFSREFGTDYPKLANYLRSHYRRAGSLDVRLETHVDVWVTTERQGTIDPATGLPCFGE